MYAKNAYLIVVKICVKAERSEGSGEVVKVAEGVVADGVAFGVVMAVAVGGHVAGDDGDG
jgi:hypothetical protein